MPNTTLLIHKLPQDLQYKYLIRLNIVSCKVGPFAVPFVEIYVPRNCADAAYVQSALTKRRVQRMMP
jgi:hypothetical protein